MRKIIIILIFIFLGSLNMNSGSASAQDDCTGFEDACTACSCSNAGCSGNQICTGDGGCTVSQGCNLPDNNNSCSCDGYNSESGVTYDLVNCDPGAQCIGVFADGCKYCATPLTPTPTPASGGGPAFTPTPVPAINYAGCYFKPADFTASPGQAFTAAVWMQNLGNTTWTTTGKYYLGSQDPDNNLIWGANRVSLLSEPVAPEGYGRFTFQDTAPVLPGTYSFNWRMLQETNPNTGWFGMPCQTTVTVISPTMATLGAQTIVPNSSDGGVALSGGPIRTSGLRSNQGGLNHNNSIIITQSIANPAYIDNVALIGAAFTSKNSPPVTCSNTFGNNCLKSLVDSANSPQTKGFVLLYANENTPNTSGSSSPSTFTIGNHYVYYGGIWENLDQLSGSMLENSEIRVEKNNRSVPSNPMFNIRFYKLMGSKTWGTYGYLMQTSGAETTQAKN